MNQKAWCLIGIGGAVLLGLYSAYETVFFMWLSATPLSPSQLNRVQYHASVWSLVLCFSLIAMIVVAFRLRWLSKNSGGKKSEKSLGTTS